MITNRLYFLPKNTSFGKQFPTRTRLVDLHWDAKHIAKFCIDIYGEEEKKHRENWQK